MYQQQQQQKDYGTNLYVDGRIVWGDLKITEQKDYMTKRTKLDKQGQPVVGVSFGLAIPKINPQSTEAEKENFNRVWQAIHLEAQKQGFQYPNKNFHWKFVDGDTDTKADGSKYGKDYEGCIVVSIKQEFNENFRNPPTIVKGVAQSDGSYTYVQLTADDVKTGDYVRVNMNIKGHGNPNAGLFINPNGVMFLQSGPAIVGAKPSPQAMFGNAAPAITFQQPAAPQGMPDMGNVPNMQQAPMMPQVPQQPMMQQQAAPYYGALPPQFQQQAPAAPQQPMMPQVPQFPFPGQGQ